MLKAIQKPGFSSGNAFFQKPKFRKSLENGFLRCLNDFEHVVQSQESKIRPLKPSTRFRVEEGYQKYTQYIKTTCFRGCLSKTEFEKCIKSKPIMLGVVVNHLLVHSCIIWRNIDLANRQCVFCLKHSKTPFICAKRVKNKVFSVETHTHENPN